MNATSLYVSTCRLVLQADTGDPSSWSDLYRLVPYLRQSLSCTVCGHLLIEPYTPTETNCQHHVCKACKGGKKKLKPSCSWCRNYGKYVENVQLRILLQCYKKLCEYITSTEIYRHLASVTTNGGTSSLVEFIQEGAGFKDEYKSTAGLSKSAYSILPCVYNTTSTSTQTQVGVGTSPQSVDAPTIKTVSNGSSLYSIMYASNNKITIKRKASRDTILYLDGSETSPSPITPQPQLTQTVTCVSQSVTPSVVRTLVGSGGVSGSLMTETNIVGGAAGFKKPKQKPVNNINTKPKAKKKGCRCGNATAMPGKLTCCGQRCPCYVEAKACLECRCRGCRNPHRPGGHKVRPHIPELQSLQIHIPATDANAEDLVDSSRLNVNVEELNSRPGNRMLQTVLVASATGTSIGDSPPSSSSSPQPDLNQGDASLEEEDGEGLLDGEDDEDCDEGVDGSNSTSIPVDILGVHSELVRAPTNFRGARVVSGGVSGGTTSALQLQTVTSMVPAALLVGDERSPSDSGGCGASGDDSDVEVDI